MQRLLTSRVSLTSILTQTVLFLGSATDSIQSGKSPSRSCRYRVTCACGSSFACTAAFSSFLVPGITVQEVWGCVRPCCCAVSHQHVLHLFRHYGLQQNLSGLYTWWQRRARTYLLCLLYKGCRNCDLEQSRWSFCSPSCCRRHSPFWPTINTLVKP